MNDDTHRAATRTLIAFLEADNPGLRWIELAEGEDPPADAVAVRRFVAPEHADAGAVSLDDDPGERLGE
jgi:hypothetical protein